MIRLRSASAARWNGVPLEAVLFDLDGTLLDSAGDVCGALNRTLRDFDLDEVELHHVRGMIGGGAQVLVDRALRHLGRDARAVESQVLTNRFLSHYDALVRYDNSDTHVYPGVVDGLRELHGQGLRLAVVTNKHQGTATRLLHRMKLAGWIEAVIGRDNCERGKPDPQPLQLACATLHVEPHHALMVGDSANDISAARAAGIPVVCVPYGYTEGQDPRMLACDAHVKSLADLPALLRGQQAVSSPSSSTH
jgi:phosphoglycolate phosphatase